jgi:hypothetical protein
MRNIIKTLFLIVVIAAIIGVLFFSTTKEIRNSSEATFWTSLITAFFTAIIACVAWFQLNRFNTTTRADFIHRFTKDFFNEPTRQIMTLLDNSALKFKIREITCGKGLPKREFPYFHIDKDIADQLRMKVDSHKSEYTAFEIDDELLGYFDDLGTFEKRGILDVSLIYDVFSYYIELVWENEEIQKYIKWQQAESEDFVDMFENFEYIYQKCKSFGNAKRSGQMIIFWKLKWFLWNK